MPEKDESHQPTAEEIEANVAKTKAEADKATAEAETARALAHKHGVESAQVEAEIERLQAEVRISLTEASKAEIELDRAAEKRREELATNKYHHVYLFDSDVNDGSTKACVKQLTEWVRTSDEPITVEMVINSPGGGIFEGFALIDFIESLHAKGHTINTTAYGMAASMGGVLLEIGKKRSMGRNSMLLIHEAQFGAIGSFGEIEDRVKLVELMHDRILDLFVSRAQPINPKTTKAFITKNWKRRDWWITADAALKLGFCDEVK